MKKHGMTNSRLFTIWAGMKLRCYNPNHIHYHLYGGKGIKICEEWMDKEKGFINFYNWAMENGYSEDLTIDRIDGNKDYTPDNCRWATRKQQANNTSYCVYLDHDGEIKSLSAWAEANSIPAELVIWRHHQGWPFEKLFEPPREHKAEKQSGVKGVIWNKKGKQWVVKGIKNGKPDTYIKSFKELEDAINFKKEYDANSESYWATLPEKIKKSEITGVYYDKHKHKFKAYIRYNNIVIRLGTFNNVQSATIARLIAEVKYFGEYAPQKHLLKDFGLDYDDLKQKFDYIDMFT